MNALRLVGGFPAQLFAERTGLALPVLESALGTAQQNRWIQVHKGRIKPTQFGLRHLNALLLSML